MFIISRLQICALPNSCCNVSANVLYIVVVINHDFRLEVVKMANNIWVSPSEKGWKVHREGSGRASGYFNTQAEANSRAGEILSNSGGGERITQGRKGVIISKDTINSHDPRSIKDTEH